MAAVWPSPNEMAPAFRHQASHYCSCQIMHELVVSSLMKLAINNTRLAASCNYSSCYCLYRFPVAVVFSLCSFLWGFFSVIIAISFVGGAGGGPESISRLTENYC